MQHFTEYMIFSCPKCNRRMGAAAEDFDQVVFCECGVSFVAGSAVDIKFTPKKDNAIYAEPGEKPPSRKISQSPISTPPIPPQPEIPQPKLPEIHVTIDGPKKVDDSWKGIVYGWTTALLVLSFVAGVLYFGGFATAVNGVSRWIPVGLFGGIYFLFITSCWLLMPNILARLASQKTDHLPSFCTNDEHFKKAQYISPIFEQIDRYVNWLKENCNSKHNQ